MTRHTAYIGIGSNVGDRLASCRHALDLLAGGVSITVATVSRWYESEAWGDGGPLDQPCYLNAAAELSTSLSAEELLLVLQEIEFQLGRPRVRPKGLPRTIDLDLLFYDDLTLGLPSLTLPHPQLTKRLFVLLPLCDIAPAFVHPTAGLTIRELATRCRDTSSQRVDVLEGSKGIGAKGGERMKLFIDTAAIEEIREANAMGVLDGVTTNPTLVAKTGRDFKTVVREILKEIPDRPVSLETTSLAAAGMIEESRRLHGLGENVVCKIPSTVEGLKATRTLSEMAIRTNLTLCFNANQALLVAKAGATYVSPFVGRLDDITNVGMDLIHDIVQIYGNYDLPTEVIVASVRHPLHVREAALVGADVCTVPFAVIKQLMGHPLTDIGIEKFLKDWERVPK